MFKIGDIVEVVRPWGSAKVGDDRFVFGVNKENKVVFVDCGAEIGWMPMDFFKAKNNKHAPRSLKETLSELEAK